jgi:hypothetical protein
MIVTQMPISVLVPTDRTVVVPIGPVGMAVMGIQLFPDLRSGAKLDFYVLSDEEYRKLPSGSPYKQWFGDRLTEPVTLPGKGPWYLLVGNRSGQPVQLSGSLNYGAT